MEIEEQSDPNKRSYKFSAEKPTLDVVFARLRSYFDVQYEITKTKTKYSSLEEMFIPKKAFSKYLGTEKTIVSGHVTLSKK